MIIFDCTNRRNNFLNEIKSNKDNREKVNWSEWIIQQTVDLTWATETIAVCVLNGSVLFDERRRRIDLGDILIRKGCVDVLWSNENIFISIVGILWISFLFTWYFHRVYLSADFHPDQQVQLVQILTTTKTAAEKAFHTWYEWIRCSLDSF